MRGLALATLFLGLCLIDAGRYDRGAGMGLAGLRVSIFLAALIVIGAGV